MSLRKNRPIILGILFCFFLLTGVHSQPTGPDKLADFEGSVPVGWYVYQGGGSTVTTTVLAIGDSDVRARPGQVGDNGVLEADFSIADFGGFGQDFVATGGPQDWSSLDGFSFWFFGTNSGLSYQAEIMDNRSDPSIDTSERFDFTFSDTTLGWRRISIPWLAFTRATDYQPGGAPNDGLTLTEMWGWTIVLPPGADTVYFDDIGLENHIIDDFESGVAPGASCAGIPLGFCTFQDAGSFVSITAAPTPPAPLLFEFGAPNSVIQVDLDVVAFAGFIRGFANTAGDEWVSQDWRAYEGFAFWLYGNSSGTSMFIDLLENRNPGSTTDDAERWTMTIPDDFSGWRYFELPFSDFVRKDVGNGAPNDGLTLDAIHGWAFGTVGTPGPLTFYLDQASLFGQAEIPPLEVTFAADKFDTQEGTPAVVAVKLTRPLADGDPDWVSVSYNTEPGSAIPDRDYAPVSGSFTFVKGEVSEQTFMVPTFDNNKHDGDKTIILRLFDPVDVALGLTLQARVNLLDDDPFDPNLIDDFEQGAYLWESNNVTLYTPEVAADDPLALPGQGGYEHVLEVETDVLVDVILGGDICNNGNGVIPVVLLTTDSFDALTVDHNTVRLGDASETHLNKKTGEARRHEEDFEGDGDLDLVFHFRVAETGYGCNSTQLTLTGETFSGQAIIADGKAGFFRDFPIGQDWTRGEALSFWFYGTNSGDAITLQLKDNRAPDPGPSGWSLVWGDEFNEPAGTPPNPVHWTHELGDGTVNGVPGWGNSELQYYTDGTENSATDGEGNLVISIKEADGSFPCYYGPCEYTSARLISRYKAEFAYGRIETRIQLPQGAGLWPAFWSLGTDIGEVGWPQTGEIDIMEFVGRQPNEIFGTIHGPGYSGGASFGGVYDFGSPAYADYHVFAIEWQPDDIKWYVDGMLYHQATPADVAPNAWVFSHPFFILMNVAVGGNFGGPVGPDTSFPQMMKVDYVRVYQGPDTAELWEATFADSFDGWQQVTIPFTSLTRIVDQPEGAPDDGLTLSEVWGYGFTLPGGGTTNGILNLDQVRLELVPPPTEITVATLNDSGSGSLRQALEEIAMGGTITFDPSLAGGTIGLTSGPLVPANSVTVDAGNAPGLTLDGGGSDRVLIVDAGLTVSLANLTVANGYGWLLAGGILNNGNLHLDHVVVTGNTVETDATDFWQGGGGIYNGMAATLNLVDSSVVNNVSGAPGGGVYSFFNTTTTVVRSSISGNVSYDIAGGIRILGNATIENSTLSGNQATGWYGGAIFLTDGTMDIVNSTVVENIGPDWAPFAVFVGTFSEASATLNLTNSIVADNQVSGCFVGYFGPGAVALNSGGHNIASDDTCNLTAVGDQPNTDPLIGPLADNGGPTLTHALQAGSPAIDAADAAVCPATDQRGVARPQGAGCDVGAFELVPD